MNVSPEDSKARLANLQERFYSTLTNFFSGGTYDNTLLHFIEALNENLKNTNKNIEDFNTTVKKANDSSSYLANKLHQLTWAGLLITFFGTASGIIISRNSLITAQDTLKTSQLQFDIENRPRIGLESFEKLSAVDSDLQLKGNEGTTLSMLDQTIKNFGNLPAYFEISSPADQNLVCVSSKKNYIMPEQSIHILCERPIGVIKEGDNNICDPLLRQQITINYGFNEKELKYQTVLKVHTEDMPLLPSLVKNIETSAPKGCSGDEKGIILQWYIARAT